MQDSAGMLAEDLQQSGIRAASISISEPRLRSGLRAHEDVHDSNELRQGLGRGVSSTGRNLDALLDRDPSPRAPPVAGQSLDPDGKSTQRHKFSVISARAAAI